MDYSLLVGVHFIDNREKLLTEGLLENSKHLTSFVIKEITLAISQHGNLYLTSNLLVEGSIDYDTNNILATRLSRGNADQFLADSSR